MLSHSLLSEDKYFYICRSPASSGPFCFDWVLKDCTQKPVTWTPAPASLPALPHNQSVVLLGFFCLEQLSKATCSLDNQTADPRGVRCQSWLSNMETVASCPYDLLLVAPQWAVAQRDEDRHSGHMHNKTMAWQCLSLFASLQPGLHLLHLDVTSLNSSAPTHCTRDPALPHPLFQMLLICRGNLLRIRCPV